MQKELHTEVKTKKVNIKKAKKEFPETYSMIYNKRCGLGKWFMDRQPIFPLVKDDQGEIVIAGTRYSRKRQHYPQ